MSQPFCAVDVGNIFSHNVGIYLFLKFFSPKNMTAQFAAAFAKVNVAAIGTEYFLVLDANEPD